MSYQLDLAQILDKSTIGSDTLLIAIATIIPLIIPQVPSFIKKIMPVVIVLLIALDFGLYGSGWKINGENLHIQAYWSSADVRIHTMEIGLIQPNSKWWHSSRIMGGDFPDLFLGEYNLKNGKVALVFDQYNQKELLLISSENKYYLIGHPGVIVLYNDLIRLGAKEKNFDK